jgi:hypothetical protein
MAFELDTSGYVSPVDLPNGTQALAVTWGHLDPFTQGYVEAMFSTPHPRSATGTPIGEILEAGFSDLAPEALAAILKDCAACREAWPADAEGGRHVWQARQAGRLVRGLPALPPLTPTLGDDGKVYLRGTV